MGVAQYSSTCLPYETVCVSLHYTQHTASRRKTAWMKWLQDLDSHLEARGYKPKNLGKPISKHTQENKLVRTAKTFRKQDVKHVPLT